MKSKVSGVFVKIAFLNQVDILLKRGSSERPVARFNRLGQDALYLSVDENSARVAMRKYASISDLPRVLIRYKIELCDLLDLRHIDADELRQRSNLNWQDDLCICPMQNHPIHSTNIVDGYERYLYPRVALLSHS